MIFQSLGSNYSLAFSFRALMRQGSSDDTSVLIKNLSKTYGGEATLFFKCRQALAEAVRSLGIDKPVIGMVGFTCYAVYQSVEAANGMAVFIDVAEDSLNFSAAGLKLAHKAQPLDAVIIQHTLGFVQNMTEIEKFCKTNNIVIIEDLAHSAGAQYPDGREVGTIGILVCLSFGRDKIIDALSGGVLIDRRDTTRARKPEIKPPQSLVVRDRIYPLIAYSIRKTYPVKLGKVIHRFAIATKLMQKSTDTSPAKTPNSLPKNYHPLISSELGGLDANIRHRREIADIYQKNLPSFVRSPSVLINKSTALRFPIVVDDRPGLTKHLELCGINIADTWYDSPIAPPRHLSKTTYKAGECPRAEHLSEKIMNLPTHREVSVESALKICREINQWLSQ